MYIRHKSKLDPRLRELAILQVGYLAKSPYELLAPRQARPRVRVSDDEIRAVGEETAGRPTKLDPLAKTVLRAAREMTNDLAMSDETFATLEKALGRENVIDLTLAIAFYNAVVRLLGTLQIDVSRNTRHTSNSIRCRDNIRSVASSARRKKCFCATVGTRRSGLTS